MTVTKIHKQDGVDYYWDDIDLNIGTIPFRSYINVLDKRLMTPQKAVAYTINTYGIDISEIVDDFQSWDYRNCDLYDQFNKVNLIKKVDDGSRKYFDTYGKQRYYKFLIYAGIDPERDILFPHLESYEVHHVFPLYCGGNSDIENLIILSTKNHEILHENPLESIPKYSFQSLDYLHYLYTDGLKHVLKKYGDSFDQCNGNWDLETDLLLTFIGFEMKQFYKYILQQHEMVKSDNQSNISLIEVS